MHRGIRDTSANYKLWLEYRNGEREKEGKEAAATVRDPLDTLLVASSPLTYSWQRFNGCTAQPSPYAVHGWAGRLGGLLTSPPPFLKCGLPPSRCPEELARIPWCLKIINHVGVAMVVVAVVTIVEVDLNELEEAVVVNGGSRSRGGFRRGRSSSCGQGRPPPEDV